MNTTDKVNFWKSDANQSLKVAEALFHLGYYLEALFFGHLALEKLLKAKIIEATGSEPIYSHDLVILVKHTKIVLTAEDTDFLARVNVYNIRARYQDYKKALYKRANKKFTSEELTNIKKFFNGIGKYKTLS